MFEIEAAKSFDCAFEIFSGFPSTYMKEVRFIEVEFGFQVVPNGWGLVVVFFCKVVIHCAMNGDEFIFGFWE